MNFDMVGFCEEHGIDHAFQGKNISRGWLGLQDPWKHGDTGYHMGWNMTGGYLYSWSTGGHSLFSWMQEVAPSADYHSALETYGDVYVDRRKAWNKKTAKAETLEFPFEPLRKVARKYLIGRGFDPDYLQEKYNLKDGGLVGDWRFRIVAPIYQNGVLVSYQGRDYTGKQELRYKMLGIEKSVMNAKHVLYNIDNCKDSIVVVEGMYDLWKWGDGCVATMGTSVSSEQIREMARFDKVTLIFDSEVPAQKRARKIAEQLSALGVKSVEVVDTETESDLGAMTFEEVENIKELLG